MASNTRLAVDKVHKFGLDMAEKARMQRAADQGHSVAKGENWYHGTARDGYVDSTDIDAFDQSKTGDRWRADDEGFFLTSDTDEANYYARSDRDYRSPGEGAGAVYPLSHNMERPLIIDDEFLRRESMKPIGVDEDTVSFWDNYQGLIKEWADDAAADGVILVDGVNGRKMAWVRDPEKIRSVNAAFDPAKKDSANLLAGATGAAVGLGALSQSDDADAGVITKGGRNIIEAWHGSPHKFDPSVRVRNKKTGKEHILAKNSWDNPSSPYKGTGHPLDPDLREEYEVLSDNPLGAFSMDNIGTGEGAQAYGHGLYFADSEDVARGYRDTLSEGPRRDALANRLTLPDEYKYENELFVNQLDQNKGDIGETLADLRRYANSFKSDGDYQTFNRLDEFAKRIEGKYPSGGKLEIEDNYGSIYRTHLDVDPDTLLDWDKPLSEQSEAVRGKIERIYRSTFDDPDAVAVMDFDGGIADLKANYTPDEWAAVERLYKKRGNKISTVAEIERDRFGSGMGLYQHLSEKVGGPESLSAMLNDSGIPGIRYLDGTSRKSGDGTSNYVMFDDSKISIQERGYADPALLLGMAASSAAAYSQLREEKKSFYQQAKQDIQAGALSAIEAINNLAFNVALPALDIPAQGYLGLAGVAGTLASGGSWEDAVRQGAVNATRYPEETTYEMGGHVTDALSPYMPAPAAAAAGTAVHGLGLLGVNALADPVPLP